MLEHLHDLIAQRRRDKAVNSLRDCLLDFCTTAFASGITRHPFLHPTSADLRGELARLSPIFLEDPQQSRAAGVALDAVDRAIRTKSVDDDTLDRLNFALTKLVPDLPLVLDEALENARFKLGGAASNVEDPMASALKETFVRPEIHLLFELAEEGTRMLEGGKLDRLQRIGLRDLDAAERGPHILALVDDQVAMVCPACARTCKAPIASAGEEVRCGCSRVLTVTRPSLERLGAHLKAERDAARGIGRCRVCSAVIQVRKSGYMRAGFCSALCARQARELFQEFVAPEGVQEGDDVRFRCACGATMTAAIPTVPEKMACLSCPLEVWVPLPSPPQGAGRVKMILTCRCGRAVKSTAAKCMYCGAPPPSP